MEFYSSENQWIIGLDQGKVNNEAVILEERPIPVRNGNLKS